MEHNFPKIVFIDLDGVICDTFKLHLKGWYRICNDHNLIFPHGNIDEFYGISTELAIEKLFLLNGKKIEKLEVKRLKILKDKIRDKGIEKLTQNDGFPETIKFLTKVSKLKTKLICIATTRACQRILTNLDVIHLFDDLIYGEKQIPLKNQSAKCILNYISKEGLCPNEVLYIDDGYFPVNHSVKAEIPSCLFSKVSNALHPPKSILINSLIEPAEHYYMLALKELKLTYK